ncbi:hypothetical protein [Actinoplanes sp. NPDC051859]|uniref:hypothetical protein n=1 Tax=Actinoplanes sp. NPDC051859 TaxID=3363909 RepID=UPI0037A9BD3A
MAAPGQDALVIALLAACTACVGYAVGRLHQWYRTGFDRDEAYRDGYETATRSVFSTAARMIGTRRSARGRAAVRAVSKAAPAGMTASSEAAPAGMSASSEAAPAAAQVGLEPVPEGERAGSGAVSADSDGGRHLVPDGLVQAATYRLNPDRVARAKVPGGESEQETTRLQPVPRPRTRPGGA